MSGVSAPDLDLLRTAAHRLADGKVALDPLIDLAGEASFVLLGEATTWDARILFNAGSNHRAAD
jgi:hypothetical protein